MEGEITFVWVVGFRCEAMILHDELEHLAHVPAGAADAHAVVVDEFLCRQGHQLPGLIDLVGAFYGLLSSEKIYRTRVLYNIVEYCYTSQSKLFRYSNLKLCILYPHDR
jgi:hypothetical protein